MLPSPLLPLIPLWLSIAPSYSPFGNDEIPACDDGMDLARAFLERAGDAVDKLSEECLDPRTQRPHRPSRHLEAPAIRNDVFELPDLMPLRPRVRDPVVGEDLGEISVCQLLVVQSKVSSRIADPTWLGLLRSSCMVAILTRPELDALVP